LNVYLDASVLVSLFVRDGLTERAQSTLRTQADTVVVSDWTLAEASSAIARTMRMGLLTRAAAQQTIAAIDSWVARTADRLEVLPSDVNETAIILRSLETTLRAPDVLHVVIARRTGLLLLTFDAAMARHAAALGARVAP
jgi:predicted nucleic acid-binding protein